MRRQVTCRLWIISVKQTSSPQETEHLHPRTMPSQADLGEGCQDIVCEVKVGIIQQDTRDKGIYVAWTTNRLAFANGFVFKNWEGQLATRCTRACIKSSSLKSDHK